ncbi:hypothetical protein DFJ63DRAFT_334203 [Scheffersomyces coipomensis]|uniref:uncharacterized protein n=1 Tax=Scheffersomyces coipomensis TaxID=1788519 RepID=UPI00315DC59B
MPESNINPTNTTTSTNTTTTNDQIKLTKLHTNPKKGYKLGSASATWKKIKSATSTSSTNSIPVSSSASSGDDAVEEGLEDLSLGGGVSTLIEYGSHGQILMVYPESSVLEIWDWKSIDHQNGQNTSKIVDTDTLHLNYQLKIAKQYESSNESIKFFNIINEQSTFYNLIVVKKQGDKSNLELHKVTLEYGSTTIIQSITLPFIFGNPTHIKTSNKFIIIGDNEGLLLIYKFDLDHSEILFGNVNASLYSIKKSSCQPILSKFNIINKFPNDDILLQTSLSSDGIPIFDIIDNWLVYSPSTFEYKHLLAMGSNNNNSAATSTATNTTPNNVMNDTFIINDASYDELDPIITNFNTPNNTNLNLSLNLQDSTGFTPVKLPASGPLLNKVLSSLSNSALDGLFKLSELSSMKVKSLISTDSPTNPTSNNTPSTTTATMMETPTLNSIGKSIGKLLYSTASTTAHTLSSTMKKTWEDGYNNRIIKILDLSNDKVLGIFKPPGGVSKLSLSPYDLQLISVNMRGDSLYMWDLYRLSYEISLIGKFQRGKTSAIISEIFWFMNNNYNHKDDLVYGNNSGFGCINKDSGSIHWFNINYLSGTLNNNHNYPNSLKMKKKKKKRVSSGSSTSSNIKVKGGNGGEISSVNGGNGGGGGGQFLDSWILSSFKAKRFIPLPNISNDESGEYINQLAILSKDNELKLISPLNGNHVFKYELPTQPVNANVIPSLIPQDAQDEDIISNVRLINPLSQAEIETCAPFLNLINNKNIEFAIYDFPTNEHEQDEHDQGDQFYDYFKEFGNEIPQRVIPIKRNYGYSSKIKLNPQSSSSVSSTGTTSPITTASGSNGDEGLLNLSIDTGLIER